MDSSKVSVPYRFSQSTRSDKERDYADELELFFKYSQLSGMEKMMNFPLYVPRQDITRYLAKYEIFKRIINVQGSIVECGVLFGGGLMWWAQLSAIFEPVNHQRRVVGFDTFAGVSRLTEQDAKSQSQEARIGGLAIDAMAELQHSITFYDANRSVGHIPKVRLVRGDACETIPQFIVDNPHFVCSLLMLDFDVYAPTKAAIDWFLPRMPKGAVIVFDELNMQSWPGETLVVLESGLLSALRIQRFPWGPTTCYAVIGE